MRSSTHSHAPWLPRKRRSYPNIAILSKYTFQLSFSSNPSGSPPASSSPVVTCPNTSRLKKLQTVGNNLNCVHYVCPLHLLAQTIQSAIPKRLTIEHSPFRTRDICPRGSTSAGATTPHACGSNTWIPQRYPSREQACLHISVSYTADMSGKYHGSREKDLVRYIV